MESSASTPHLLKVMCLPCAMPMPHVTEWDVVLQIQLKIFTGSEKPLRRKTYLHPKSHRKSISKGKLLDNWWQTKAINKWMAKSNLYVALLSTSTSFFLHSLSFLFAAHSALSLSSSCIWSGSKSSRSSDLCICNLHSECLQHQEEQAFVFAICDFLL